MLRRVELAVSLLRRWSEPPLKVQTKVMGRKTALSGCPRYVSAQAALPPIKAPGNFHIPTHTPPFFPQSTSAVNKETSARRHPAPVGQDCKKVWGCEPTDASLSTPTTERLLTGAFQFDALPSAPSSKSFALHASLRINRARLAEVSLHMVEMNVATRHRLEHLIKQFPRKKDLQQLGATILRQTHFKTHTELPRVLPSRIVDTITYVDDVERAKDRFWFEKERQKLLEEHSVQSEKQTEGAKSLERIRPLQDDEQLHSSGRFFSNTKECTVASPTDTYRHDAAQTLQDAIDIAEKKKTKLYDRERLALYPEAALAYVAEMMPSQYAVYYRVLSEVQKRLRDFVPRRVIEYGAKGAPGIAVVRALWGQVSDPAKYTWSAIEPSRYLTRVGQYLLKHNHLTHIRQPQKVGVAAEFPEVTWKGNFDFYKEAHVVSVNDLIMATFALEDLATPTSRRNLIKTLWNQLDFGGLLAIVEPGTPTGFRWIHDIRELFITSLGIDKFHFVAPCPHESACPLGASPRAWCHFSQRHAKLPKYIYQKMSADSRHDTAIVRFSYLIIRKGPGPRRLLSCEDEASSVEAQTFFWGRLLAKEKSRPGQCTLGVCSHSGRFEKLITRAAHPRSYGYKQARRASRGDLWPYPSTRLLSPDARSPLISDIVAHRIENNIRKATKSG